MPQEDNLVAGFLKVRNGILRGGNIYRVLYNLQQYCDQVFVVDDASYDGTYEYLLSQLPKENIIRVPPEEHDFGQELEWKQKLIELIHRNGPWKWIFWIDDDEVLDARGTDELRDFCRRNYTSPEVAWKFHYTQFWRNSDWARVDEGFDNGWFIKLWKWTPHLSFKRIVGTHHAQFPEQIMYTHMTNPTAIGMAPYELIHYGNYGINLRWKCIQYWGGLGGVDRHLVFPFGQYRKVPQDIIPIGVNAVDRIGGEKPQPFTLQQVAYVRGMENLKSLKETFCIILPTHNRAYTLRRALDSLIKQTYDKWICVVLDDASTDDTDKLLHEYQEKDPRIFSARYLEQRGGVAMNEIGMEIAVQTADWWVRIGSDDWFHPRKLEYDAYALKKYKAVYGPFVVHRDGSFDEIGNYPCSPELVLGGFVKGGFYASWANVAVASSVLKEIKQKFGTYCDLSLMNMEDRLFNFRVAKVTDWAWRGVFKDNFILNPSKDFMKGMSKEKSLIKPDAVWNVNQVGASAAGNIYARDSQLTTQIIEKEKDL